MSSVVVSTIQVSTANAASSEAAIIRIGPPGADNSTTATNAADRAGQTPAFVGQILTQTNNNSVWVGLSETVGAWARVPNDVPGDAVYATTEADLELADSYIYIDQSITLTANRLLPDTSKIRFGPEGEIVPAGNVMSIYGPVTASPHQHIFQVTTPYDIRGTLGGVNRPVAWFGAMGNDSANATEDWLGISAAIFCGRLAWQNFSGDASDYFNSQEWATATYYKAGSHVLHNGNLKYYVCLADHTSAAADEPGVGASWETNWYLEQDGTADGIVRRLRNIYCSRVILYAEDYYVDRPIDARGSRFSLESSNRAGHGADSSRINAVDSAEWAKPSNWQFNEDYPAGTAPVLWIGSWEINRKIDRALSSIVSQFGQRLLNLNIATTDLTGTTSSCILFEGSLEEGSRIEKLDCSGFGGYGLGGARNTTVNGLQMRQFHINCFKNSPDQGIPFMMTGSVWSLELASLNHWGTGQNYCARVGGQCGTMRDIHTERPSVAGIDVVWNWFGAASTPGSGGSSPVITLENIEGTPYTTTAPVVRVANEEASVACINITRRNPGDVIEDVHTGKTTQGTLPGAGDGTHTVALYARQADYLAQSGYRVVSTDPELVLFENGHPLDLADGTVLTLGESYYESLTAVGSRTYTFSDPGTGVDFTELFMVTDTALTLTIPSSRQAGSSGTTTSIILASGNHHLRWKKAGGEWWLTLN